MSLLANLNSTDKEILRLSPFWVFYFVYKTNGKTDVNDLKRLKNDLFEFTVGLFKDPEFAHQRAEAEVSISILESVNANFSALEKTVEKYDNDYLVNLSNAADIVDAQFNRHEAQLFKQILVKFAINIADSSGGWKFPKNNIKKLETTVISNIKKALKYRETYIMLS